MDKNEENFLRELLNDFKIEAAEHYETVISGLFELEKPDIGGKHQKIIENVFREVHSLKGASRAVNLPEIEKLCMTLETIFGSLKKGESKLFPPLFEAIHQSMDLLQNFLVAMENPANRPHSNLLNQVVRNLEFLHKNAISGNMKNIIESQDPENATLSAEEKIIQPIKIVSSDEVQVQEHQYPEKQDNQTLKYVDKQTDQETVRISTSKLNTILRQSEEMITIKSTVEYIATELQFITISLFNDKSKLVDNKLITSSDHIETVKLNQNELIKQYNQVIKSHLDSLSAINKEIEQFRHISNRMIDDLLLDIKSTLLYPFSTLLNIVPKIVRDLSKEFSKSIDVKITGDQIEIDRRILEEIKDPLIHLIRNCIDHGIETKTVRAQMGKPEKGLISIDISQEVDKKIVMLISDDGSGIDKQKVINSAVKNGILKVDDVERLSESEIYSLIFNSGVSASQYITNISGRGLGMAIVAEKVEKLGGQIELSSNTGKGIIFRIVLPQTVATFRGILVQSAGQYFTIPSSTVERALKISTEDIRSVESRKTICVKNETIALVNLSDLLRLNNNRLGRKQQMYIQILVLNVNQSKLAITLDEVIGEIEGIVKDLGPQLIHVKNIGGATILGNGKVVPILNINELMDSASHHVSNTDYSPISEVSAKEISQKSILVVEDSITIRSMLRNFIENAGYSVKTAVDGMDGFTQLQSGDYDLVVSDIEMPRMNGFELTSKIRENKKYSDIPVILVTALESSDDRQRGLEAGANAYIVKSSFEKSNLIETIQRLI